ncbi:hypothetical protein GCM10010344_01100 [Streptomyces bluensis]|nr:hypothetical protein GCM10010344_01100 [Streptomyces bluensis]
MQRRASWSASPSRDSSTAPKHLPARPSQAKQESPDTGSKQAVRDGSLSAKEIDYATRGARWNRAGDDTAVLITVSYPADNGSAAGCYQFSLPKPLSSSAAVSQSKLNTCPG